MSREAFRKRFMARFYDPAFRAEDEALVRLEALAWDAYSNARKSPITEKAGAGFKDPDYELSVEWKAASDRIKAAQARQQSPGAPSRVLIVNASARNDYTCPGEMSKSFRLGKLAQETLEHNACEVDFLDLSRLNSDHDLNIHPCKGCVSTAMPLCHWPCSCYPNHSLGLVNDWMNEIYEKFAACHGVIFVTPVYWYQVPSPLKLLMDRLVCADGGNPDPTSTHGKKPDEAKRIELEGWDYPKHLAGRAYGLIVHGDVAGIEGSRRALSDWLDWMGLIESGAKSRLDRFIGYYEPYATSHTTLDNDDDMQREVVNVAKAVAACVTQLRRGHEAPDAALEAVRAK
ncbi:flavodoxin family protein [Paraburkholderia acidisoli]|uniref:NADPH-dependent FMN reductase n=1 Tax=Paraburkholderia acidisoli TaxID=2571748 RepID=A0A7Z2GSH0_9BURK|nr:flavodoxin family protein [Paraburkholderia acidisoli]QGZ67098.1 NADPH-dependent FMN reductase [Paraburkholderia acidisoli]